MNAAARLLDAVVPIVRTRLPAGVDADYLDGFLTRNRPALEAVIERSFGPVLARMEAANSAFVEDIPEFWTASKRTAANIAAMATASKLYTERRAPTAEERAVLAGYSGWGGLSIQSAAGRFPPGFPPPEERGLIHEFYTPSKVAKEVASGRRSAPGARGAGTAEPRLARRISTVRGPATPLSGPRRACGHGRGGCTVSECAHRQAVQVSYPHPHPNLPDEMSRTRTPAREVCDRLSRRRTSNRVNLRDPDGPLLAKLRREESPT